MQTRVKVEGLHNCREFFQPLECLCQATQTQEKGLYCFYKTTFEKKRKTLCLWNWLKEKYSYQSQSVVDEVLYALSVPVLQKICFLKYQLSLLKMSAYVKKIDTANSVIVKISNFQPTRKWVNKLNLSSFHPKTFSICACVINMPTAKHIEVTTLFTNSSSCKHASPPIRACVLS